jgi:hypothetical protein
VFERIICGRLTKFLDQKTFFNKNQAGYQKGRSTQEHLLRLSKVVYEGFRYKKCTISVFLDCEAAFDAVWLDGSRYKLLQAGIPHKMIRIISSFLTNRSLSVLESEA